MCTMYHLGNECRRCAVENGTAECLDCGEQLAAGNDTGLCAGHWEES